LSELETRMREAAAELEFEEAARLRDEIRRLEEADLGLRTREGRLRAPRRRLEAAARSRHRRRRS
jgi:excinuclease ABC subunit B